MEIYKHSFNENKYLYIAILLMTEGVYNIDYSKYIVAFNNIDKPYPFEKRRFYLIKAEEIHDSSYFPGFLLPNPKDYGSDDCIKVEDIDYLFRTSQCFLTKKDLVFEINIEDRNDIGIEKEKEFNSLRKKD